MSDKTLEVLEYRKLRGQQLRDQVLFKILSQLDEHNVTLVELTEFYRNEYDKRITSNVVAAHRAGKRRSEMARKAVNTRWKRHFDFLAGSTTYADKLKTLGAQSKPTVLPTSSELKAPNPPLVVEPEEAPTLDELLSDFGDD